MTNDVVAIGLRSLHADMARVDQAAMNLANSSTPGYKRGHVIAAPVRISFAAQLEAATEQAGTPVEVPVQIVVDPRPGTLRPTGQLLDVAIEGRGYFEVLTDHGPAYTRQGSFRIDTIGRLVTMRGEPVMGVSGPITIGEVKPTISGTGEITSGVPGAAALAQLKVVDFDNAGVMVRMGEGLFAAAEAAKPVPEGDVHLRQGFLESSNVNSALEMTALVQAMRHFETIQKVLQGYDEMAGSAIRKLGEIS